MPDHEAPSPGPRAAVGLPLPPRPMGEYRPAVASGGLVWSAGMTPRRDGALVVTGIVGGDLDLATAREAAGLAALNALSAVADAVGGLERITGLAQLTVYVACGASFTEHSAVADGASDALARALGDVPCAARVAVGVASLPGGAPVEVQLSATYRP